MKLYRWYFGHCLPIPGPVLGKLSTAGLTLYYLQLGINLLGIHIGVGGNRSTRPQTGGRKANCYKAQKLKESLKDPDAPVKLLPLVEMVQRMILVSNGLVVPWSVGWLYLHLFRYENYANTGGQSDLSSYGLMWERHNLLPGSKAGKRNKGSGGKKGRKKNRSWWH